MKLGFCPMGFNVKKKKAPDIPTNQIPALWTCPECGKCRDQVAVRSPASFHLCFNLTLCGFEFCGCQEGGAKGNGGEVRRRFQIYHLTLGANSLTCFVRPGNSLLLNSSMQPDLTVSRTYSGPICLQDPMDKELMTESSLFNPLSDIKVKVQSSFMVSLGVTERAEYHGKAHSGTFPHGNNRAFGTIQARNKATYIQNLSSISTTSELKTSAIFGYLGGRLVVPNTGG